MHRKPSDVKTTACNWCFWQDEWNTSTGDKVQSLELLGECTTAKDFFVLFNRLNVSAIPQGSSLHIFREHARPEWEDKSTADGGHYRIYPLPGTEAVEAARRLSCLWFDVVRNIVGEHIKHGDKVVGISFTKKSLGQIVALWLSDASEDVAQLVLSELLPPPSGQPFKVKFFRHKDLPQNDYKLRELRSHRRSKSAPIDLADDEPADDEEHQKHMLLPPQSGAEGGSKSLLARRALAGAREAGKEHARSHSDSQRDEGFMMAPLGHQNSECASSGSSGQFAPTMVAPTPIKDWTQGWSPSQFMAAQQIRTFPLAQPPPVKEVRAPGTPPPPIAESAPPDVAVRSPQAIGLEPPQPQAPASLTPGRLLGPPAAVWGKSPQVSSAGSRPTGSPSSKADAPSPPPVQSDRKPFVCRGKAYPPGLNRKEHRAIVFNNGETPKVDAYDVDDGAPDGEIDLAQFEAYKRKALKCSDPM
jgi:hypothetical protein